MSEQEPPINFDEFAEKRRSLQRRTRVWVQRVNPADALRGRFITGSPSLLRAMYAPRTSASRGNLVSLDREPIA